MRGIQASVTFIRSLSTVCRLHGSTSTRYVRSTCIAQNRAFHITSFAQNHMEEFDRAKQRLGELTEDPGRDI